MNGKDQIFSHSTKKLTYVRSNTIGVKRLGWGKETKSASYVSLVEDNSYPFQ